MSVIRFTKTELAEVAALALYDLRGSGHAASTDEQVDRICGWLEKISKANVACFRHRYGPKPLIDDGAPSSRTEIRRELAFLGQDRDLAAGVSVAQLLHYNCCEDRDFLEETEGGLVALIGVLEACLSGAAKHGRLT